MNRKLFWFGFVAALAAVAWLYLKKEDEERQRQERQVQRTQAMPSPAATAEPDPLTEVTGIGPVYAQRLQDAGVRTFGQLAALSAEQIRAIVGIQPWQADVPSWIAQAKARAA